MEEDNKFYPLKRMPDNFEITKKGVVKNKTTGNVLKPFVKNEYYMVRLNYNGKNDRVNLSRLLAENFISNPDGYKYVCFRDENKLNYKLENLYWTNRTPGKEATIIKEGVKFGELTVIKDLGVVERGANNIHRVVCKCVCNDIKEYNYTTLNTGKRKDCGCVKRNEIPELNITSINNRILKNPKAKRYIIEEISAERKTNGKIKRRIRVKCRKCSEESEINYKEFSKRGKYGCYSCAKKDKRIGRGDNVTHDLSKHPLYATLSNMRVRCYNKNNPDYKHYGARGIKICDEWKNDFREFYDWAVNNGWNHNLSIDRINNNGNYEPSNCRWVSRTRQNQNKSTTKLNESKVRYILKSNKSTSILAEELDVSIGTISSVRRRETWSNVEI